MPNSSWSARRQSSRPSQALLKGGPPAQNKCRGLHTRARPERHDAAVRSIRPRKQDQLVNKHTVTVVIAAAIVISLSVLGWYALVGYVVTIGSARDLTDIADATAHLFSALLGAVIR
jgi:hypothetical protein